MERCKSCKWWRGDSSVFVETDSDWGLCRLMESDPEPDIEGPSYDAARAIAWGAGSDIAGLSTRADFGCVEHEAKEGADV